MRKTSLFQTSHFKLLTFLPLWFCLFPFFSVFSVHGEVLDSVSIIIKHSRSQTKTTKYYDPSYVKIPYPGGDVPLETGVCTDVIIRAFRSVGIDLQKLIHIDMVSNFSYYPQLWGTKKTDSNIDHRRVPNIVCFLKRKSKSLPVTNAGPDYLPGDIVTWKLPGNLDHIGLVADVPVDGTDRFGVVHNIGNGAELEDVLFHYEITGHFRYFGK